MSVRSPGPGMFVSHTATTEWEPDPNPGWLVQGSIASMPKGAVTTGHLTAPFRELWVLGGE